MLHNSAIDGACARITRDEATPQTDKMHVSENLAQIDQVSSFKPSSPIHEVSFCSTVIHHRASDRQDVRARKPGSTRSSFELQSFYVQQPNRLRNVLIQQSDCHLTHSEIVENFTQEAQREKMNGALLGSASTGG